jgi:hypothetical protein
MDVNLDGNGDMAIDFFSTIESTSNTRMSSINQS